MLVDEEVDYGSYEGESEEGITTSGRLVDIIEEAADLHVEGHTGKADLLLWRHALESVIPQDDKIFYYQLDSTGGCSHATTEGASSRESDNAEPEYYEPKIVDPQTLDPLPDYNIPNFQQENRQYLLSISNVRTEKVSLQKILDCTEVDVLTIDRVLWEIWYVVIW